MSDHDRYVSPLSERYASREMQYIFSPDMKFCTWRKLWIALAETEKELGLSITDEQIEELKAHSEDINYDVAKAREKEVRHDVMSHVYAYGVQCPKAKGIIHLGATSCYVGDNTDIIIMTEALKLVRKKLLNVLAELSGFAEKYKDLPTLAFTHFQPAQPTTVGKRATLWMMELKLDLDDLDYLIGSMRLLGSKGTTGTQASFLELFDGDHEKCRRLDARIAEKMGFEGCYPVSGQTYSRKVDSRVISVLAGIAQSAHKFSNDIRLLQHLKEVEEPFEKKQIGSLIMKYNRQMYEYGKDFRSYGTDKMLRVDQMSIINLIGDNPKCNLKLIAQSTDSNISTVSLQVARLVKLGLLEKHRSSMNQREIVLSLSGEGMKAYEFHKKLDQNWSDTVESLLSGYTKEELAVINAFLHQLLTENPPM